MSSHEAVFRITTEFARPIYDALVPEFRDEVNPRSTTRCRLEGPSLLILEVHAQDTEALRAALNMALRLVNVAEEMHCLVKKNPRFESPEQDSIQGKPDRFSGDPEE